MMQTVKKRTCADVGRSRDAPDCGAGAARPAHWAAGRSASAGIVVSARAAPEDADREGDALAERDQ